MATMMKRRHETGDKRACVRTWNVQSRIAAAFLCLFVGMGTDARADYWDVAGAGALEFDGINDYVNLGNSTSLQLSGDMSACAWCKLAAGTAGRDMGIVGKMVWVGGHAYKGFTLFRWDDNGFWFFLGTGAGYYAVGTDQPYTDSEWHHVAGTIRGGVTHLYVDGILAESYAPGLTMRDSGQYAFVGKECSNVDEWFFKGLIDDVRIYNRGLSSAEIEDVMTRRPSGSEPGLVGSWSFDEMSGQTVRDGSGRGNNGCLGATATQESSDPKRTRNELGGGDWTRTFSFDTYGEYASFVSSNNFDHPYSGGLPPVRYLTVAGSHGGVLCMSNREDAVSGHAIPAWAGVAFGSPTTHVNCVCVNFDYRFNAMSAPAPKGLLVNLGVGSRVGRLDGVVAPLPTSAGGSWNGPWAQYDAQLGISVAPTETVIVELTLRGPEGTAVQIDNLKIVRCHFGDLYYWSPIKSGPTGPPTACVRCITNTCDLAGIEGMGLGPEDFYAAVVSCGSSLGEDCWCLDQTFTCDGFATIDDVLYWSWASARPALFTCGGSTMWSAAYVPGPGISPASARNCTVRGPLIVAGKSYSYDPEWMEHILLSDRVFGVDTVPAITGQPCVCADDGLSGRVVEDTYGNLYQIHVTEGLVSLNTGRSILAPGLLSLGPTQVRVGWDKTSGVPPIQDAVFDNAGNVYVVPVVVKPPWGTAYRGAARISPGLAPEVLQIYGTPQDPLFKTGAYEIELGNSGNVYVLDKRHWDDSRLLRYHRDSGLRQGGQINLKSSASIGPPTAFHISGAGRIWLADQTWNSTTCKYQCHLVELRSDYSQARRIVITGMNYISGVCAESSTGTMWATGFGMPQRPSRNDVLSGVTLLRPPDYKAYVARVRPWEAGPVNAVCLDDYQSQEGEHISLPLSIVWRGY